MTGVGADNSTWVIPARSTAAQRYSTVIGPDGGRWRHTGLLVAELGPGESTDVDLTGLEAVVVPLAGGARVTVAGETIELAGRASVFAGATDVAYAPAGTSLTVAAPADGPSRVAVGTAVVRSPTPGRLVMHLAADRVVIEQRGAGQARREVRNIATPAVLDADRIIACEVITPAGCWSSYPPHKHDEDRPGQETALEEIYYFELQANRDAAQRADADEATDANAVGYQRVYGDAARPIDVLAEVRSGDVVLVPHGWHGPSMAPPGYDLYYLNVMAGGGPERAWLICDDPAHAWVRRTWGRSS